jgi:hypothetical protein
MKFADFFTARPDISKLAAMATRPGRLALRLGVAGLMSLYTSRRA